MFIEIKHPNIRLIDPSVMALTLCVERFARFESLAEIHSCSVIEIGFSTNL